MKKKTKRLPKNVLRLVVPQPEADDEYLLYVAHQLAERYGKQISGIFVMVRLGPEHRVRPITVRFSSWPDIPELIGVLHLRTRELEKYMRSGEEPVEDGA